MTTGTMEYFTTIQIGVQGGQPRTSRGRGGSAGGSAECVCGEGVFGWCEQCANSGVCCSVPSPMEARLSPSQVLPLAGCGAGGRHTVGWKL